MEINNLPMELQSKVFGFLSHPCADIIRSERERLFRHTHFESQDNFTHDMFQVVYFLRWKKIRRALQPYSICTRLRCTKYIVLSLDPE